MHFTSIHSKTLYITTHALYLVFFASLIFSFRALSSISIALILLAGIISTRLASAPAFRTNYRAFFLIGCALFFLVQLLSLLYTRDIDEGWNNIRIKTGLLVTPLAVYLSFSLDATLLRRLLFQFCLLLGLASLFCLGAGYLRYQETGDPSQFFYHSLVSPLSQHAVSFSLFLLIGLIFLVETLRHDHRYIGRPLYPILLVLFSVFLFLLSSKLVISYYLVYLVASFIMIFVKKNISRMTATALFLAAGLATTLVFSVPNPVSKRFYEIVNGDLRMIARETFTPHDYFNGLQFRLLQWRLVTEILTENRRWWTGVSAGDAQSYLNKKYLSKNMYAGDPALGTRGYLRYNTHNQFLEATLQSGIVGLGIVIVICFCMVKMATRQKNRLTIFVTFILLAWLFTESAFETQYGIIIFTFFPMFLTAADIFKATVEKPGQRMKIGQFQ